MRNSPLGLLLLCSLAALSTGCKEYFSVDEACHPEGNFRGRDLGSPAEASVVDRMNCYRRLTKLERYGVEKRLYESAAGHVNYMVQNPDVYSTDGELAYLRQSTIRPGFTGTDVYERMDAADYQLYGVNGNYVIQVVGIIADSAGAANPGFIEENFATVGSADPGDLIDYIMRLHWLQESVLAPSVYDVAYVERPLDAAWWEAAAEAGNWASFFEGDNDYSLPVSGKAIYYVIVAEGLPYEHSTEPITYPKDGQTGSALTYPNPVYKEAINGDLEEFTFSAPVYISYISPSGGGTATTTGSSVVAASPNPFDMKIQNASITGPSGPLDVAIYNFTADDSTDEYIGPPVGSLLLGAGVYATTPFQPNTPYTVYMDLTTTDGPQSYNWSFTTGAGDTNATTAARSQGPDGVGPLKSKIGGFRAHKQLVKP